MQPHALFCAQELHALEVAGQEEVAQIKARAALREGTVPEDQVLLLAGTPREEEAPRKVPGRCRGKGQSPTLAGQEKKIIISGEERKKKDQRIKKIH
uniref:Uncharacterized protein n=1 Tax=Sus scrofa TaxID=9823 RepID=A0A8D2A7Z4_PIG